MSDISAREVALNALARREHSEQELKRKLLSKGYAEEEVLSLLETLQLEHLQSDERFAESYVNARVAAGFGPAAIRSALQQRGVSETVIQQVLSDDDDFWWEALLRVWQKKYRGQQAGDRREYARQMRFLMQRGFASDHIHRVLKNGAADGVK